MQELDYSERRDWLRLIRTSTVGPVAFRDLLKRFKSPTHALGALPDLVARTGRRSKLKIPSLDAIEAELRAYDDFGARLLAMCEPDYPDLLRAVDPAPPLISVLGNPEILQKPTVALVGSRNASAVGLRFARQIAAELGEAGYTIVSGLARGIDASAHAGSIDTGTAAVLGGGLDHIYPQQNTDLYHDIARYGVVVSETPIGHRATARDFPRRNRIISGLSLGVVVIEAAERSGTLITARYALEQNREVMAAPGSPLDPRTKGCNRLIRDGAALIETTDDIIDVLRQVRRPSVMEPDETYLQADFDWKAAAKDIDTARAVILNLCSPTPTPKDEIIRQSGYPVAIAGAALLELELVGDIVIEGDGRVSLYT